MQIVKRFEDRLNQPGESETRYAQRRLAMVLLLVAAAANVPLILHLFNIGLYGTAFSYMSVAAVFLLVFVWGYSFPKQYALQNIIALLAILIGNLAANFFAGGYTSGFEFFIWVLTVPVWVALFAGRRTMILMAAAYLLVVLAAGLLEPLARSNLPEISPALATMQATFNYAFMGIVLAAAGLYLFNRVERYRRRADDLLLNILPASIAVRLKASPQTIADSYEDVTVLFADIVDFTTMSSGADPAEVVNKLNEVFSEFDALAARHGLEKIKTIGDAYMVAGGLPQPRADHCQAVAAFAVEMVGMMARHNSWRGEPMRIRVGINCGPVVAGVIGQQKFIYDLWGDTVNVASRMESQGLSNEIQVTRGVKERLDGRYTFEERAPITIKGKGKMVTYLLRAQ